MATFNPFSQLQSPSAYGSLTNPPISFNPAYGISGGYTGGGPTTLPPQTPGFQTETPDMGISMGGTANWTPPPGAVGLGSAGLGSTSATQPFTTQDAIGQGMNFGQYMNQIGATGSTINATTPQSTWDQFRQSEINDHNTMLANNPALQAAGVQPLSFSASTGFNADGSLPGSSAGAASSGASSGNAQASADPNIGVTALYQKLLGRTPDAGGMQFYQNQLSSGMTMDQIANEFKNSPEYMASHPGASSSTSGGLDFTTNPYAGQIGGAITNRVMTDYLTPALNQIRSGAVATGGLGGTREGVAQGEAIAHGMDYVSGNLANAYGDLWNQDQNRGLQQYGMDQNFYTAQRGLDQSGIQIGANLYNLGEQGQWSPYTNYGSVLSPFTGFGTTTGTNSQGGGGMGLLGGAIGGAQLANLWTNPAPTNYYSNRGY